MSFYNNYILQNLNSLACSGLHIMKKRSQFPAACKSIAGRTPPA